MRVIDGEKILARIFVSANDTYQHHQLHKALLERLRKEGFAGATSLATIESFGTSQRIHTEMVEVASDLPMVIEVVDDEARLDQLTAILDEMMHDGMVTIECAHVIKYSAGQRPLDP